MPVPRPKQRTPELREHVLATAVDLLARDGVSGLTTREVARCAGTSPPAIYELFGDKAGLVREIFLDGFRKLRAAFESLESSDDPRADAIELIAAFRRFASEQSTLVEVMFARPFADFRPEREDILAAVAIHDAIIERIARCIAAGVLEGDATDIAHALMALSQGLAAAENAGRLGSSKASADRRWRLAIEALLQGLGPTGAGE